MKRILFLFATCILMVCVLSSGCTSPTEARIKPYGTSVPTPVPTATSTSDFHGGIDTPINRDSPVRTKCEHRGNKTAS